MAAQNQHFVPKFILRQFTINERDERVRVYDKHTGKEFTTSIKNIMAERRFNEFMFDDDYIASFEEIAGRIEDTVIPVYRHVIKTGVLENSPEQQATLAFFIAFQFVRTKASRDMWRQMEKLLREHVERMGGKVEDIEGYEPATEENIKKRHLLNMRGFIEEFTPLIAAKNFMLMRAHPSRAFYIGDHPVVLHNAEDHGPYGNLGLGVHGIEIYMPLSSNLVLCAMCPSVAARLRKEWNDGVSERQKEMVAAITSGKITISDAIRIRESLRPLNDKAEIAINQFEAGGTIDGGVDQVDFINSLQAMYASRFVICKKANLALAKRHNEEFPKFRSGVLMQTS
ncbi:DUF4238 domain-containing protein [Sphingomonas sp. 7/4-4]|uniref:DUF4238 domain-containing protein n=1 Tax=Sphingomonas sp. 7/4-4 TaxID=3018446 RepID=UPI0022F38300|nr:DUF4238 domain-containing protein [Sphingomonas sp. 7/4-4]WBY09723.1 DUF4238 domain-containing protein [Sphingomonas sp. 7/4-4]